MLLTTHLLSFMIALFIIMIKLFSFIAGLTWSKIYFYIKAAIFWNKRSNFKENFEKGYLILYYTTDEFSFEMVFYRYDVLESVSKQWD